MPRRLYALCAVALALLASAPVAAQTGDAWQIGADAEPASEAEAASVEAQEAERAQTAQQPLAPADAAVPYEDTDPRALTDFRDELDPHGRWIEDPRYGTVWVPSSSVVGSDFAPYVTNGHWALDENDNWVWVSDYPWGWVVYHYGRWVWISGTGWAWIPGRAYAPSWVVWRVPEDGYAYVGWSPAPPTYIWRGGVAVVLYDPPPYYYVYCPSHYVFASHVHVHVVHHHHHVRHIHRHTRVYHSSHGRYGPPLHRARVPARAVPQKRVAANPRAVAAATRSSAGRSDMRREIRPRTATRSLGRSTAAPRAGARPLDRSTAAPRAVPRPRLRESKTLSGRTYASNRSLGSTPSPTSLRDPDARRPRSLPVTRPTQSAPRAVTPPRAPTATTATAPTAPRATRSTSSRTYRPAPRSVAPPSSDSSRRSAGSSSDPPSRSTASSRSSTFSPSRTYAPSARRVAPAPSRSTSAPRSVQRSRSGPARAAPRRR